MRTMRKLARIWMVAAVALLMAGPAFADGFTETEEPFAKSAAIYAESFHAFAPRAALPTPEDFVTVNLGPGVVSLTAAYRPWITYHLREPGRFKFELQRIWSESEEALGVNN